MMKRDTNMLHGFMCSKQPDPFTKPIFTKMNPSMIEELEARGYDLTTLKFSIMKKPVNAPLIGAQHPHLANGYRAGTTKERNDEHHT